MAELLKDSFGPEVPDYIARLVGAVVRRFPRKRFISLCLEGYDELELMARGQHISDALAIVLPDDRGAALQILIDALAREGPPRELQGMEGFRYLPIVDFVADHGLDHFELAMTANYEITKRFTAEFCIRPYLEVHRDATLERLRDWTADPSEHVRRLVSEGTRPRLPWATRLRAFMADPTPVIELLELLKDDGSEYVRRSVANNLNDIAKDHPALVIDVARRWWPIASPATTSPTETETNRRRLVKHGLRSLIKQGHPDALDVIGYGPDSPLVVSGVTITPTSVAIGGKVRLEVELTNASDRDSAGLIDLVVHFVKANGTTSPKVFKGAELAVLPGGSAVVRKTVSLRQHTTRTHHGGEHRVEVLVNGRAHDAGSFTVTT